MIHAPAEPTIEELLADPLIRALMRADKVDPRQVDALMRSIDRRVENRASRSSYVKALSPHNASRPVPKSAGEVRREVCGCLSPW